MLGAGSSPFAPPNSRSTPKFRHSLFFTLLPINPRATLPHGRPVPAQISKLHPRLPAAGHRHHYPQLTAPSVPSVLRPQRSLCCAFSVLPLCFLSHPCNPCSFMRLRTLLRNGAPPSPLFSTASALFLSPRGCTLSVAFSPVLRCSNLPTPVFASVWRLFVVPLRSFLHSVPLFSMACGLFSENTRGGGYRVPILRFSAGVDEDSR
jgi:hypothetical protein